MRRRAPGVVLLDLVDCGALLLTLDELLQIGLSDDLSTTALIYGHHEMTDLERAFDAYAESKRSLSGE